MATKSVTTLHPGLPQPIGTEADLYLTGGGVLTVYVSRYSRLAPPSADSVKQLHYMVEGLARASIAIANTMMHSKGNGDVELWNSAAESVAFATMLLNQLAEATSAELSDAAEMERAA